MLPGFVCQAEPPDTPPAEYQGPSPSHCVGGPPLCGGLWDYATILQGYTAYCVSREQLCCAVAVQRSAFLCCATRRTTGPGLWPGSPLCGDRSFFHPLSRGGASPFRGKTLLKFRKNFLEKKIGKISGKKILAVRSWWYTSRKVEKHGRAGCPVAQSQ